ncbi:Protein of unknown function [Micromonospora lupini str. Lupac 08]|uniref:Uncharacterized protein n=1 Tax=Micromonospora lupini str. Lupac 08 TaxID=1150864 RepID=I0L6J6_9ACTN|nr:Protein of unknown function [Micromonospora lupini str. Lupac 08]
MRRCQSQGASDIPKTLKMAGASVHLIIVPLPALAIPRA